MLIFRNCNGATTSPHLLSVSGALDQLTFYDNDASVCKVDSLLSHSGGEEQQEEASCQKEGSGGRATADFPRGGRQGARDREPGVVWREGVGQDDGGGGEDDGGGESGTKINAVCNE